MEFRRFESELTSNSSATSNVVGKGISMADVFHHPAEHHKSHRLHRIGRRWQIVKAWLGLSNRHRSHEGRMVSWRPMTLRAPILGGFIIVSLAFIVVLEILYFISVGNNDLNGSGLAFAIDENGLSALSVFSYTYFPTILAVCYSMLWGWVDLDAKRLEPWYQLSRTSGADAKNSLLLQYPFDLLPFIPITAFRRKHWAVFLSGTIMLLVFWVITPLQSSIFNNGTATRTVSQAMATAASLSPVPSQFLDLNINFLNSGYAIAWLGQMLPAFTTIGYAMLPFQPTSTIQFQTKSETWTTTGEVFSTDLICTPAEVSHEPLGYIFSNGRGCTVSQIVLPPTIFSSHHVVLYLSYYNNAVQDWSIGNPNCTEEHSNNFLALWASAASLNADRYYDNLTAAFCIPTYQVHNARVTVNASDGSIANVTRGDLVSDSMADRFNTSHFEYLMGVGVPPTDQGASHSTLQRANYPDIDQLEQFPDIANFNVTWPVSNMVGFALAINPFTVEDLYIPENLRMAFERAHRLLFATAINVLTRDNNTSLKNTRSGTRQESLEAIIMVRRISLIVETTLALITIMTFSIWYYTSQRANGLSRDPASISDIMFLIGKDLSVEEFKDDGSLSEAILKERLTKCRFFLAANTNDDGTHLASEEFLAPSARAGLRAPSIRSGRIAFSPVRPMELHIVVGIILIVFILGALAGIIVLGIWSTRFNGISLPSTSPLVLSLLQNYVPTAIATILEPAWVTLNRVRCVLQPFDDLRKGNAASAGTVEAKYTSLPPQLVVWRALRSRHFFLAALCIIAISGNLLAVALSGLITQNPATTFLPISSSQNLLPKLNGTNIRTDVVPITYSSHLYAAMANLSGNNVLPPWMDSDRFYLPFTLNNIPTHTSSGTPLLFGSVQGSTIGFGADLDCSPLSRNRSDVNSIIFDLVPARSTISLVTYHRLQNGTVAQCTSGSQASDGNATQFLSTNFTDGASALEVFTDMVPLANSSGGSFCSSIILAGWARMGPATPSLNPQSAAAKNSSLGRALSSNFISCTPKLKVATYNIDVDISGRLLNSIQTSGFASDPSIYFANSTVQAEFFSQVFDLIKNPLQGLYVWHNDSFTSDWQNSLFGFKLNSNELVDPARPAPSAEVSIVATQAVYSLLFAMLLNFSRHVFAPAPRGGTPITVTIIAKESRFFISPLMARMAMVVLGLQLITAVIFYARRPKRFLPRMPTSVASIIAYVAASHAVEDYSYDGEPGKEKLGQVYGYGAFVGTDGKTHVGIEKQELVVPVDSVNPDVKRRGWWKRVVKRDEGEIKNWI